MFYFKNSYQENVQVFSIFRTLQIHCFPVLYRKTNIKCLRLFKNIVVVRHLKSKFVQIIKLFQTILILG